MKARTRRCLIFISSTVMLAGFPPLNAQDATVTILKEVSPVLDDTIFSFTIEGEEGSTPFQLMGEELLEITLVPGTYVIREDVPENWELSLIRCGDIYQVGPVASGAVELAVEPGESVLCRFDNTRLDVPPWPPGTRPIPAVSPVGLVVTALLLSVGGALIMQNWL